jgi:hypothetical protein
MGKPRKPKQTPPPADSLTVVVDAPASRCPKPNCGSTRRTEYHHTTRQNDPGQAPDGTIYQAVIWRRTTCLDCGQNRADKTYEIAPGKETSGIRNIPDESASGTQEGS